jgi:hypothetical protein
MGGVIDARRRDLPSGAESRFNDNTEFGLCE